MRIVVHDYPGHAFPFQLSRCLARRGHEVLHIYSASIASPRGDLVVKDDDAPSLRVEAITLAKPVDKYSYVKRTGQELVYSLLLVRRIRRFAPDVVLACGMTIDSLGVLDLYARSHRVPWFLWLQDIQSVAIRDMAASKLPVGGELVARYFEWRERRLFHRARRIIAISDDFHSVIDSLGGPLERVITIENWAPVPLLPVRPKRNPWSERHALHDKFCFLYSGTMGLKHNPQLLVDLAERFRGEEDVRVVVVSEGPGADFLAAEQARRGLNNLLLLPWQPFEDLPDVLGCADVLLTILNRSAGVLSTPSKILSALCAGRAQLLAVPENNLAVRVVRAAEGGLCVAPDSSEEWLEAADRLLADATLRQGAGEKGRRYAEATFDIERITDRFLAVIER